MQVYCRLRPLKEEEIESCAEAISDTVLQITPPECSLAYKSGHWNGVCIKAMHKTIEVAFYIHV